MKSHVKRILQQLLGLETYLLFFAIFRVFASRIDSREAGLFAFIKLLPDRPVVLDIGANIGVTATIIQQKSPSARVIAFEPLPMNLFTLRDLFKLFGVSAEVIPCAVGNAATTIEMILPKENGAVLHGLSHLKHIQHDANDTGTTFQVDMVTLDDSSHLWGNQRVDAIKLDVENAESLVLSGARRLLERDRPLIYCELWDNENRRQSFTIAHELGYAVNVLVNGKLESYDSALHTAKNFFLLPPTPRVEPGSKLAAAQSTESKQTRC